jgi:hypothetical protein
MWRSWVLRIEVVLHGLKSLGLSQATGRQARGVRLPSTGRRPAHSAVVGLCFASRVSFPSLRLPSPVARARAEPGGRARCHAAAAAPPARRPARLLAPGVHGSGCGGTGGRQWRAAVAGAGQRAADLRALATANWVCRGQSCHPQWRAPGDEGESVGLACESVGLACESVGLACARVWERGRRYLPRVEALGHEANPET